MRRHRWGLLAAGLALLAPVAAAQTEPPRTVRIATEGAYPPFNFVDPNGALQGFEIDLGRALCAEMKVACSFVVHQWDGIIRSLVEGQHDAIMASLHITKRRQERIAFSKPYYRIPPAFIAMKERSPSGGVGPMALAGQRIGVLERSEHARFLQEVYRGAEVKVYGKLDEANLDLLTDRLDLVFGNKLALFRFLDSREGKLCCRFAGDLAADPRYFGEGAAIGLRKEDHALKAAFDAAIERVMRNGTYDRIRAAYFPFEIR